MLDLIPTIKNLKIPIVGLFMLLGSSLLIVAATSAIRYHELLVISGILLIFSGIAIWIIEYRNRPEVRKRIENERRLKFMARWFTLTGYRKNIIVYNTPWFIRRLSLFEDDFLEICDFIPLNTKTAQEKLEIGAGSKLLNFSINVCSEIETLCRKLITFSEFDEYPKIEEIRNGQQNMNIYRELFNWKWGENVSNPISNHRLKLRWEEAYIYPFKSFENDQNPEWFHVYSKYKHDKIQLSEKLDFLHCLESIAGLTVLLINYPYRIEMKGETMYHNSKIFDASLPYVGRSWE